MFIIIIIILLFTLALSGQVNAQSTTGGSILPKKYKTMSFKVIIQPDGYGGTAGTWVKHDETTDDILYTDILTEAWYFSSVVVDDEVLARDPTGALGLYSGNPISPPPPPF